MNDQRSATGLIAQAYVELIERLDALRDQAEARDWSLLGITWREFVEQFEQRCKFEEEVLFPAYAEQGRDARALVKRLVEEHAAMRQLIGEIGHQIRRRRLRPITQELLAELMAEHAALETAQLEPWIALDPRDWSTQLGRAPKLP